MSNLINIYCDESCHLEHDNQGAMVLGAVWCPQNKVREIRDRLREIRKKHNLSDSFEIKWTKVSKSKVDFYKDILDYFFDDDDLHFRALVIPNKGILNHQAYNQSHDDWYYKMYFDLLKVIIDPRNCYRVYLDIKDTRSASKIRKLHDVLANQNYDFKREIIKSIISVRSDQVILVQLADLLIGAVAYVNRLSHQKHTSTFTNQGKYTLVQRTIERSKYTLTKSTLSQEQKFNIFVWQGNIGDT